VLSSDVQRAYAKEIAKLVHADKKWEAARAVADTCKLNINLKDNSPAKFIPVLQNWLHFLLNSGGIEEAAQLLWTPNQFTPEPQYTKDLWKLYSEANMGLIMGAGSCSKSFGMGVRLFLEWIRDPDWTSVRVIGPSQDHLESNLFSHLVSLHNNASLPMPGQIGELFIGEDRRNQNGSIKGVIIPIGKVKKAGRLQGSKRKPRPQPHPIFGPLSRMFIFIDEIENVPGGLWSDVDNILTQVEEEGGQGFKIFGAYNPTNQTDEVGKRAEPPFGWEGVDADKHYRWKSVRGWDVLRLDGEKSENVIQGKIIYPGLQTKSGLETIAKNAGGRDAAGYSTMGRGMYPKQGITATVIPPGMLPKWRGEFIWLDDPDPVASADLALEGGAACSFTLGLWGKATGMRLPPSIEFPKGQTIMFRNPLSLEVTPRWALQAESQLVLPKGDTIEMKDRLITLLKRSGVKPQYFCCDATGHGKGIADLIKHEWSTLIHAINYSEGATTQKLMLEDTRTCEEEYDRITSELWFAMRAFGEFGYFLISPKMDMTALTQQLTQRRMILSGKKSKVESKRDYMSRGYSSPDEADSMSMLIHAVRMGSGTIVSRLREGSSDDEPEEGYWFESAGVRIDVTNRTESLDGDAWKPGMNYEAD
jgi:hypothetical protein